MDHGTAGRYTLRCVGCGWETDRDDFVLHCPNCGPDAFLRSHFSASSAELDGPDDVFWSYRPFLPYTSRLQDQGPRLACLQAPELGAALGLDDLWIALSAWAPELGSELTTSTFKGVEALGVFSRVLERTDKTLIVSSAGNAGRAFLEIGSRNALPAVVVVPAQTAPSMLVSTPPSETSPLLVCLEDSYYPEAIRFVTAIVDRLGDRLVREGGAFNVARRDSMGVPVLRAIRAMGRIPDHYFQAVGSGTGGIAAWEASLRMRERGVEARGPMALHLVQNIPFTPMVDAWAAGADKVAPMSEEEVREKLAHTYASVLANATPPYSLAGGVRQALLDTGGEMIGVTNEQAQAARDLFREHIDVDPCPESAAAMAGMIDAVRRGTVARGDRVLLHVTGGGAARAERDLDKRVYPVGLRLHHSAIDEAVAAIEAYLERCAQA